MNTTFAKSPHRSPSYTKFATPLVLDPPRHCGLATILLGPGKHLLGTAPDCSVRVPAEDVLPRHALIVVGEHRTVVKALDPRTWVNDGPVTEMALRPGDRLSIGPLTFRVRAADRDELVAIAAANEYAIDNDFPYDVAEFTEPPTKRVSAAAAVVDRPRPADPESRGPRVAAPAANPIPSEFIGAIAAAPIATAPIESPRGVEVVVATKSAPTPTRHVAPAASPVGSSITETNAPVDRPTRATESRPADPHPTEPRAGKPRPAATTLSASLDLRLDEIEQKLAEMQEPIRARTSPADDFPARTDALLTERRQLVARQDELQQRADELARQSQQLHERVARVAEREAEVERSQTRLALEHEQLRATAEVTRKELDDEYARHRTLWQEWDAAYRRTSGELNGQLQSMEQRRIGLLAETDRVAAERSELQRLQAEHERDRRMHAAERVQLTTDRAALQSLRAEFDTERQQHLVAVQEREASVASERRTMSFAQEELLATRQQLERERSEFLAARSTEALRRERDVREHVEQREQLDRDHARIRDRQLELEQARHDIEAERAAFASTRDAFEAQQAFVAAELARLRERLQQTEARLDLLQQTRATEPAVPVAAADSAGRPPAASLDWLIESCKNIHTPPPIPTEHAEESSVDRNFADDPMTVPDTTDVLPLTRSIAATHDVSRRTDLPGEERPRTAAGMADSFTDIDRGDRDVPKLNPAARVTAPAAASHRFWEDDRLYDTSVASHTPQQVPTSFTASSNLMSVSAMRAMSPETMASADDDARRAAASAGSEPFGDSAVSTWSRSLDDAVHDVASEVETRDSTETATSTAEVPRSVEETLSEINRQFGIAVPSPDASTAPSAARLPSWWSESGAFAETTVKDILRTENPLFEAESERLDDIAELHARHSAVGHDTAEVPPTESADPLSSLRAQLAQMFDLPGTSAASHDEGTESAGDSATEDDVSDEDHDGMELTLAPTETDHAHKETDHANKLSSEVESVTASEPHTTSASENAATVSISAAEPATDANSAPGAQTEEDGAQADDEGGEEDSIEACMARLLSRTRGTDVTTSEVKSLTAPASFAATSRHANAPSGESPAVDATFDPTDRSHLTAEPKHKQDRQAARDDLQSFRRVAHQSARSALARHTTKNLLSAVIAKSMLLGISALATTGFFAAPLVGFSAQIWKGVACLIATLLSATQVYQSWRQLRRWTTTGELPKKDTATPVAPSAPAPEKATPDTTTDAALPAKPTAASVE